jgi:quercetin dioxygenase-like cupin family protein
VAKRRALATTWGAIPPEDVRKGVRRRAFGSEDVILVLNEIEPEMEPAPHAHEGFDQMALVISGRAIYHIGEEAHRVGPGSVMLIPAGETHWIEPDGAERIENLDVFAPARKDFLHLLTWMESMESPAAAPGDL